ncbi:ribonuclease H-like domain-containing protein [Tanacetum coccineum]|uniref:Ribonuclease H-like domain-containing protein n=1 Tax=Tanacetum coccineum TaxID=301880 RepID=A0ABQ5GLA6_9ASTR
MPTHLMVTRAKVGIFKPLKRMNCHVTTTSPLPRSYVYAFRGPNWKEAMLDEYNALITNGTWVLVPCLANVNVVRSMWLFKHKFNADGSLSRYKARLVANGRISRDGPIHQLDVNNDFLHGHLSETVYMHQPLGFVDPNNPNYSKLGLDGDPVSDPILYRSLAGALQYLTFTRPDLSYAVQQAGCSVTRRFTSGYCVFLGDNLLSWSVKRQVTLFRSSAEAEYRGMANVVAETAWIRNLLCKLHTLLFTATLVYCDNVSAVYMFANPVQHQRTKHIEIEIHFVRDFVASGQVRVLHVLSRFQYAYIFTKGLPIALFIEFRSSMNVRRSPAHIEGEY